MPLTNDWLLQAFSARTNEDITDSTEKGPSLMGTLEEVGVQSLDTSIDQSRGTLRGVNDTADTELIEFSEEDTDKSMEEGMYKSPALQRQ